ncbi:MAG: glycine cleavage system aminomethyltransferase GcvT [Acidimicrobiales bacterium]
MSDAESAAPVPLQTPLAALHDELGGRMVDFAGWSLPVHYEGAIAETNWVRASAGLFDVSHMGVVDLFGNGVAEALETITPAGITTLQPGKMRYALLTNAEGGLIDDMMVTRPESAEAGEHLVLVVNGARRAVDLPHLRASLAGIEVVERAPYALLALQGPKAVDALARLAPAVAELVFMEATTVDLDGTTVEVSRSGYTGEDGFELVVPAAGAETVARALLAQPEVRPAGLGARDALRLEAGLCLYGHDLDETISPVEADLVWSMPKRRREAGDFLGGARVLDELANGTTRVRVGLAPEGKRPVREGATLSTPDGEPAGVVTSGGHGPTVERPVAMGYVPPALATVGTRLIADVRGNDVPCVVADLPFTPHRYVRGA